MRSKDAAVWLLYKVVFDGYWLFFILYEFDMAYWKLSKDYSINFEILLYSYNRSQRDALILNFILVKNSTCFGQIYCPSSGVLIPYSQQLVFVILVTLPSSYECQDFTSVSSYLYLIISHIVIL